MYNLFVLQDGQYFTCQTTHEVLSHEMISCQQGTSLENN